MILDYLDPPNITPRVLVRERWQSKEEMWKQKQRLQRYRARSQGCRQPLEAGKGKEVDSPLELPEGMHV